MPPGPVRPLLGVKLACNFKRVQMKRARQIGLLDSVLVSHTGEAEGKSVAPKALAQTTPPALRQRPGEHSPRAPSALPDVSSRLVSGGFLEWHGLSASFQSIASEDLQQSYLLLGRGMSEELC